MMLSPRTSLFSSIDSLIRRRPRPIDLERGVVELGLRPKFNAQERPLKRTQLHDVTNDVLIMIFDLLTVKDVLSMRQVSCNVARISTVFSSHTPPPR